MELRTDSTDVSELLMSGVVFGFVACSCCCWDCDIVAEVFVDVDIIVAVLLLLFQQVLCVVVVLGLVACCVVIVVVAAISDDDIAASAVAVCGLSLEVIVAAVVVGEDG